MRALGSEVPEGAQWSNVGQDLHSALGRVLAKEINLGECWFHLGHWPEQLIETLPGHHHGQGIQFAIAQQLGPKELDFGLVQQPVL